MLNSVPDAWGPKIEHEGIALTRTHTGPNSIQFTTPDHLALVMFSAQPGRTVALNSDHRASGTAPVGSLEIVPAGSELYAGWVREKRNVLLAIDPGRLRRLAETEFDSDTFEFHPPQLGTIDSRALDLARLMQWEVENQDLGWRECVDALSTAFSIYLLREHSSLKTRSSRLHSGGLPPVVIRRIDDFIQQNLRESISLARLASIAQLSIGHFTRSFKTSTGLSPHQYIIEARLTRARQLIISADMPLDAIAECTGFSGNSHLTATMRRQWNTTPTLLQRER